ncbi:hypothetical protein BDN67DRAFT_1014983 [Paxillus ammoniavirescens]|nr:hypothetical protein BDN67DRAFT_1014983 [Paxillus ammoniavirescens]
MESDVSDLGRAWEYLDTAREQLGSGSEWWFRYLVADDRAPAVPLLLAYVGGLNGAVISLPESHRLFNIFRLCYHTVLLSTVNVAWVKVMTRNIGLDPATVPKVVRSTPDPNECDSDPDIGLRDDEGHACLWRMPYRQRGI